MRKRIARILRRGEPDVTTPDKVDYIVDPRDAFDYSTNLIPFLDSTGGSRAGIASKMMRQALPLKHREQPWVQVLDTDDKTFESKLANPFVAKSPVAGTVQSVTKDYINVADNNRKTHKVPLYNTFPLGGANFLDHEAKVKKGDKVSKGQLLADTTYTKDGSLALGTHLRTGYVPHKYTYEDGIVISDKAADKLTSMHLHKETVSVKTDDIFNMNKVYALYPEAVTPAQRSKLDERGVVKKGTTVNPGDPLAVYLTRRPVIKEDVWLQGLNRALAKPYERIVVSWNYEDSGVVTDVSRVGSTLTIYVKTEERAKQGDKLMADRHGGKGVITAILPSNEMPKTRDGEPMDILISPLSIPTRQNPGQILSGMTAKAAQKFGRPIEVKNFDTRSNVESVEKLMRSAGVEDKEELLDEKDRPMGKFVVQPQFVMKLDHPARKKFSARYQGMYDIDRTPAKSKGQSAQSLDALTMYSLLGHASPTVLQEMATYKAERNPELWRRVQMGEPLPPPQPTFAWGKFQGMLRGMGANIKKDGTMMQLVPLTDHEVLSQSRGEIKRPDILRAKDLKEIEGGLMDPRITGGKDGAGWGHIHIADKAGIPNPIYERAILNLTGINKKQYEGLISGKMELKDGKVVDREEEKT